MVHATILAFDGCLASSLTAITDVFAVANQLAARDPTRSRPLFSWKVVSPDGAPVRASSGLRFSVDGALPRGDAGIVFLPALHFESEAQILGHTERAARAVGPWLRRQRQAGAWLAAGCSGTLVAAHLGLLDGKVATTSWWLEALFRRLFPRVDLRMSEVVTQHGDILCAGPPNSHFNLALRLVAEVGDPRLAVSCAKALLVDPQRPAQAAYASPATLEHEDELVARADDWMRRHLRDRVGIAQLARAVGASHRNLIRRFKQACGRTPLAHLQRLRIEAAKQLLESSRLGFEAIVTRVGYEDVASFRRLFRRSTTLSPGEYRRRFAVAPERGRRSGAALHGA